jgi:hypothetical protein
MISADTSTWVAFLQGKAGKGTDLLDRGLLNRRVFMAPIVETNRCIASEGAGETPQSPSVRRADRVELR